MKSIYICQLKMKSIDIISMGFLNFDQVWIYLNNSILNTVLGILAGLLISIYLARRGRLMEISYFIENELVIGNVKSKENSEIKILYKDVIVPRLEKMRLVVWNSGNNCIDATDVVRPLEFKGISKFKILQVECLKKSKASIDLHSFDLKPNQEIEGFTLNFNYLDPNDGFVFEFTHTGDMNFGSVQGEIKKMGKVKRVALASGNWRFLFSYKFISTILIVMGGILLYHYLSPGLLGSVLFFGGYYAYMHFFVVGSAAPMIPRSLEVEELRNVRYPRIGGFL